MNLKYLFWFCFWLAVAFIYYKVNGYYQKFKFYCRQLKLATTEMRKHVDEITAILKS